MNINRELVLSLKSPVVFQGYIADWEVLGWKEDDWCALFGDNPLPFRCGLKKCTPEPQWERTCKTEYMTMSDFLKNSRDVSSGCWRYFDYKYLEEWVKNSQALNTLSWSKLGFPEVTKGENTLWIGSSGAHTPCHMDSYGCNLVAQIQGHKQWVLFPPSEGKKLKITRVPYEESSVYSSFNFSAPIDNFCDSLENIYIVTLSPGDVLFVPRHWWHYVENLDTAISINTWIPLPEDDDSRLDEVLVRFFVSQVASNLLPSECSNILNPNEDDLSSIKLDFTLPQMESCIDKVLKTSSTVKVTREAVNLKPNELTESIEKTKNSTEYHQDVKRKKLSDSPNLISGLSSSDVCMSSVFHIKTLTCSSILELKNILDSKCKCGSEEEHTKVMTNKQGSSSTNTILPALINSFCHPDILKAVKSHLLEQVSHGEAS